MESNFENTLKIEQKILDKFNKNILPNSLLLYGSSGIGKTTLVQNLCKKILNIESLISPDLLIVSDSKDKKKNIGIDEVRNAIEFSNMSAIYKNKVLVFDGIDNMSIAAVNSMLKLLEEVTARLYIFLITTNLYILPQTLRSRCMQFYIEKTNKEDFFNYIDAKLGSNTINRGCIDYLYDVCEGNLNLVFNFLSTVSNEVVEILSQGAIENENLVVMLEKSSDENFELIIKIILFEISKNIVAADHITKDKLIKKFEFIHSEYNKINQYSLSKTNVVFTISNALAGLI